MELYTPVSTFEVKPVQIKLKLKSAELILLSG